MRLDRAQYSPQITEALTVLRGAKREFEKQGYEVETLRIVTQPLGELVSGQSDTDALAFLKRFDEISVKERFLPSVGPAMLRDAGARAGALHAPEHRGQRSACRRAGDRTQFNDPFLFNTTIRALP